jgi:predicted aminopeptidase
MASAHVGARGLLAAVLCLTAAACSPTYVLRAGYEEAKILWRREPIARVLAQPDLAPETRKKLETVLAARRFAHDEIGLNVGGSFSALSTVDGDSNVVVLTASRRNALEPYSWWFPIVGRVPYKGFFDRDRAAAEAAALEKEGYDVYLRPAATFSTLGWFDDPLLRHLLKYDEGFLVNLVLHETYHNTFYLRGQTAFNESLATFVGHRGAIAFFAGGSDTALLNDAERDWDQTLRFAAFLDHLATALRAAYAAAPDEAAALAARTPIFERAKEEFRALGLGRTAFTRFLSEPLNNAVVLHYLIYSTDLDLFEQVHRHKGDLKRAIALIQRAAKDDPHQPFAAVRRAFEALPRLVHSNPRLHSTSGSGGQQRPGQGGQQRR